MEALYVLAPMLIDGAVSDCRADAAKIAMSPTECPEALDRLTALLLAVNPRSLTNDLAIPSAVDCCD